MTAADVLRIIRDERRQHVKFRDGCNPYATGGLNRYESNDAIVREFDTLIARVERAIKEAEKCSDS